LALKLRLRLLHANLKRHGRQSEAGIAKPQDVLHELHVKISNG
jgi:hypothetical protein